MKQIWLATGLFVSGIFLSGCNGSSGENGDDPFGSGADSGGSSASVIQLSVVTKVGDCSGERIISFTEGDSVCVEATLLQDEQGVSGEIISFTAPLGALSTSTRLTDANGVAQIELQSELGDIGAATLVASYDGQNAEQNYEFIADSSEASPAGFELNLSMLLAGQPVSRFTSEQTVTINAILVNGDQQPISNEIVTFSSALGVFQPSSALTDTNGIAQVQFSANAGELGADTLTAQVESGGTSISNGLNFQILAVDQSDQIIRFGSFDENGVFNENQLAASAENESGDIVISAGATVGFSVGLVDQNDQRILAPTPVTFSSNCVQNGLASIDEQVTSINGEAFSTFEDISCASAGGNTDTIVATLVTTDGSITLSRDVEILPESIGSIAFVSAQPESIVLNGTGGQGLTSVSTVTFQVDGALGNPLAQQLVNFDLNTNVGGLTLSPASGFTNSQGQVSTRVTAGNVPTSVRVTASTETQDGVLIQSQSDLLSVNTGLPDQNSMTLAASVLNPEAFNRFGEQVTITVRLADSFNNPVPDGTAVSFTTEGGTIEPSCTTTNGNCSVLWTSSEPRPNDHRITILATAIGHETLFDSNGNNIFDEEDVALAEGQNPVIPAFGIDTSILSSNTNSGFGITEPTGVGFVDMSEAWRDDNENGQRDVSEFFLDFNSNGNFDESDAQFNAPNCLSNNGEGSEENIYCSETISLNVRKAIVLVASSSSALMEVINSDTVIASNYRSVSTDPIVIASGESRDFSLFYSDAATDENSLSANQPISSGSTISITTSAGELVGQTNFTFGNTNRAGPYIAEFSLINTVSDDDSTITAVIEALITAPSGEISRVSFDAVLE